MATVTGELAVMLGVLGLRKGDDRILKAIALLGPAMEVEEFDWDDELLDLLHLPPGRHGPAVRERRAGSR